MNAARIEVTPELLVHWFDLPEGNLIKGAEWNPIRRTVEFRVEGPDMPECDEGATPKYVTPTYRKKEHVLRSLEVR